MNLSTQNLHLTQSEPGKIDPMGTPDRCEEANQSPRNPLKHCDEDAACGLRLSGFLGL